MSKKKMAGILAACVGVGLALGAGVKFHEFVAVGAGMVENADVDGLAKYKYNANSTFSTLQVIAHGLKPNTTYSVLIESDVISCSFVDVFTTNNGGNGNYQNATLNVGDLTGFHPRVTLFIWDHAIDGDGFPMHVDQPDITDCGLIRAISVEERD